MMSKYMSVSDRMSVGGDHLKMVMVKIKDICETMITWIIGILHDISSYVDREIWTNRRALY